ncbi:hypothetical protein [Actinomyces vulturis]|uniref:hypothetical protein n=1 Tax=Actinomyces vulturis TaxID=1857645 RepID=UPI0008304935|nr:hypothetical protein [Actinomyces vulturis]
MPEEVVSPQVMPKKKHRRVVALSTVDRRRAQQGLPPVDAVDSSRPVTDVPGGDVFSGGDDFDVMDRKSDLADKQSRERQLLADVPPHWS